MKAGIGKQICVFVTAWFLVSVLAGGCACVVRTYNVSKPEAVYVKTVPPAAKAESQPARPSGDHVWVKGAWEWNQTTNAWEWKGGSWVVPPDHYVWVDANYEAQSENIVVYTPGHWDEAPANPVPVRDKAAVRKPQNKTESTPPATKDKGTAKAKPDVAIGRSVPDSSNSSEAASFDKTTGRKPEKKGELADTNHKSSVNIDNKFGQLDGPASDQPGGESGKDKSEDGSSEKTKDKAVGRTTDKKDAASSKTPDKVKGRSTDKSDDSSVAEKDGKTTKKKKDKTVGRNNDKKGKENVKTDTDDAPEDTGAGDGVVEKTPDKVKTRKME